MTHNTSDKLIENITDTHPEDTENNCKILKIPAQISYIIAGGYFNLQLNMQEIILKVPTNYD